MFRQKYSIILLLLIKVLKSPCDGTSSLTFVIDDTLSMWDDIKQVQEQVEQIMDVALQEKSSEIKDFVLVSFNDPVVTLVDKTSDRISFTKSVNSLYAHNVINRDCPEMAMGGIKRGLEESSPGSYVYVFTDASAKDYEEYEYVIDLCQSKQSQVVFVLTGDCFAPTSIKVEVYYKVAAACSGQVFRINKDEVTLMIDLIRVNIRGKKSLLASRVVPSNEQTSIPFAVDDKVKSVLVSTSGLHVNLKIRTPSRDITAKKLMWTDNSKAIELTDLVSGDYTVLVSGHSSTSVVITARTDFSFEHGFSTSLPRSSNETVSQPIADKQNFLSVTVTDPENEVNIKTAQILDMNDNILIELPLERIVGNFYTTDEFSSPNHMIKIGVKGIIISNGQTVRRISKTPVIPKIITTPPRITNNIKIFNGVIGDVALRIPCNVTGYPKPDVSWTVGVGGPSVVEGKKYMIKDGALVINNPIEEDSKIYRCTAKNAFGSDAQDFKAVVKEDIDYENIHEVYILEGESKKIKCPVPHTASDSIRWYINGNLLNVTGSYMNFINATVWMDGNYTCRVSNSLGSNSDTILVDVGYEPKFTIVTDSVITDWEGDGDLNCDVSAKPSATAEWYYKGKPLESARDNFQLDIFGWGEYTCRIKNVHSTVEKTFKVSSEVCLVNRDDELDTNTPVIITESYTWPQFETRDQYLIIDSEQRFKLLCSNTSGGFQNFPGRNEIVVKCDHEDSFSFEGKLYKYSDFHCNKQVIPVIKKTGHSCLSQNTETIRVGFSGTTFIEAYDVCYDTHENVPLYTHITLTSGRYKANRVGLKWSKYPEIGTGNQDKVYTCVNNSKSCCYTKGQMINTIDVNFGPVQVSTYIDYLNAVPVWLPCTERTSWSQIGDIIRKQLIINPTLSVWSGASKYAQKNEGKVPRYLWKVVKIGDEFVMAVVYVNEPTPKDDDILCQNICNENEASWLKPEDKFTYCCKLEDFLVAFELQNSIFV